MFLERIRGLWDLKYFRKFKGFQEILRNFKRFHGVLENFRGVSRVFTFSSEKVLDLCKM